MTEDFLLHTETARTLYHDYAKDMPIYDYHCHLPPDQIAQNRRFENLTQAWLAGDHYKWRAMRANGVDERLITGDASDWEKFEAWASTVPATLRNPLYHWTHLELKTPFGITDLLNADSARRMYDSCSEMLQQDDFTTRGLLKQMNVKVVCTTDDPVDSLEHHIAMAAEETETKMYPAWRPDMALAIDRPEEFLAWLKKLEQASGEEVKDFESFLSALQKRHDYFHEHGCRLSDHGLEQPYAENYKSAEIRFIFDEVLQGNQPTREECLAYWSCVLHELALMDHARGWVQQFHLGAIRNVNAHKVATLGKDTGYDSIGDFDMGRALGAFLNRLESKGKLCKTILYNLNPRDNALFAAMIGNFQDGSVPGKMQFGSGWWFLDQKHGMIDQLNALSNMGLLSRFVGMLTDSRSFLSYPRHEYFRRILCSLIGDDVENGELPSDMPLLGSMVQDICWNNADNYFDMQV
jgi:glucuronate isomerase